MVVYNECINSRKRDKRKMFKDNDIVKVANIQYTFKELKDIYFNSDNHYIVKYKSIYQVFYSVNAGFYANEIYYNHSDNNLGYTLKGRHIFTDSNFINKLVGFELLHI
jgi:hypothetical protein